MDEISKALTEYASALEHFQWAEQNNLLAAGQTAGELAFYSAINLKPPFVVSAFVATMEIAKQERERVSGLPKRQRTTSSAAALQRFEDKTRRENEALAAGLALSIELSNA